MRRIALGLGASLISVALASGVALAGIPASNDARLPDLAQESAYQTSSEIPTLLAAKDEDPEGYDAPQHKVDRMHELTGLPKDQIIALRTQHHLGWGEVRHVASLNVAVGNQVTVEQIVAKKTPDHGWGAIAKELGLHPSVLGRGGKGGPSKLVKERAGGPPGHAKAQETNPGK